MVKKSKTIIMKRREFLKSSVAAAATLSLAGRTVYAEEHPNFLWLTCEDISPYLGCYGCKEAQTPNLDNLAAEGIRYTRAYAPAPVCAVARSSLLTGMYSSTLGTHHMRIHIQMADAIPTYPQVFREAGYYCTNNSKEDYNSTFQNNPAVWDESSKKAHYKNRKPGQPFFAVFNFTVTHESQLDQKRIDAYVKEKQIPAVPRVDPASITLPPYHPDLPEIRQDWARLHDLITLMDSMVGEKLQELEALGEADNTIVMFYADHGGQLSRAKRYIYNVGTQVPFIVKAPKKWQHLVSLQPGSTTDRLVNFIDFPKTVIALAGLKVPELMQGNIFLGPDAEPKPKTVHFYRDRMAERYDFSRAVTDGRWYYIRNFMPHRPRGRDTRYGFTVQANWRAWEEHYAAGKCSDIQSQFFQPKPPVELFDTETDPWHVNNLATAPEHQEQRQVLEKDLEQWMLETRDLGLVPEPMFFELVGPDKAFKTRYDYGQSDSYPIERILPIAKQASEGKPTSEQEYLRFLQDEHPVIRYWGAYGLFLLRSNTAANDVALQWTSTGDTMTANRIMAAQALGVCSNPTLAFEALLKEANETPDGYAFLFALNALQYSHTDNRLTKENWETFQQKLANKKTAFDPFGYDYAGRIIEDALTLWPERRIVD
jgi:N-sulfoglucosamine sulfohydrolase